jgi:hypothetical protein
MGLNGGSVATDSVFGYNGVDFFARSIPFRFAYSSLPQKSVQVSSLQSQRILTFQNMIVTN